MKKIEGFYTLKGYEINEAKLLTNAMEDYLEMVYRLLQNSDVVRIRDLAESLHVKPSSASKMANNLKDEGWIEFEKYSYIKLTPQGAKKGKYLIYRHETLNQLLCCINHSTDELEQVEKIEHFFNEQTIHNMHKFIESIK